MTTQTKRVRHAVVPSAGRGTRFLPITKAVPKEMLPIVDRPAIEYVVREATDAGIDDMLFVTRTGKEAIEAHFDADPGLEGDLAKAGKTELLELATEYTTLARTHSVRQGHPLGLGHAVLQAKHHVGDSPFAVMLPDDLMHPASQLLRRLIEVRHALGGSVVALLRVTPEQATAYATTDVTPIAIPDGVGLADGELMRINQVVEKPPIDEVLSEYAVVGRYVFDPAIFEELEAIEPGRGGEYQLTDGFARLIDRKAEDGGGLYGVVINDRRFDTGDKLGYLQANIALALEDPDLGEAAREIVAAELARVTQG
ncbi:UTP--glucose-1-phosphate uridylyltransferase [Schaalia suimastitidis]|uniref:UTP--glucose-1-phosphate uridylyltransferase n=1 Tax=Schaalia suimastitidis TaxID=121163 RepID=UPI000412E691|nr:UTP--glucose-1-phosphate uridylyltransferase [Schaalia suimastitidis]